ncbi:MAG: enoyl-CoA hydratase/isomerase family protein [Acidimicrobiia bacterium]
MSELVRNERLDNGVALLTLDRPPVNALATDLLRSLGDQAEELANDPTLKAVVVTGGGKHFAAGANIDEFVVGDPEANRPMIALFRRALDGLGAIPRPVIAAVNGFALGGGFELALACDLRIAADNARVGFPEILLGLIPGAGGTQRAARLVGPSRAKELVWSGRQLGADEALALGLIDRVVGKDELLERALEWARSFASGAVVAMGIAKTVIDVGIDQPLEDALDAEREAFLSAFATRDHEIGITSFRKHGPGKAEFTGS